jgi:hypothetical protein
VPPDRHGVARSGALKRSDEMNINSGKPWSEMDLWDLTNSLAYGSTVEEVADFLCRDVEEVRDKVAELGLAGPGESPP